MMTAPPPGICVLMILIWIRTVCVWSDNEKAERLIGLHGLFCHLYFSVHRGYLKNYNCCWVGRVLMFFNQIKICLRFVMCWWWLWETRISRSVSLCINVDFFWQMKALLATTTMKIFLFLDSNNVFGNKVSAALMCRQYSETSLFHVVCFSIV